jgi:hypothetical protein
MKIKEGIHAVQCFPNYFARGPFFGLTTEPHILAHVNMTGFFYGTTTPNWPEPPHYRGFTITLRHTALGRTPLDE